MARTVDPVAHAARREGLLDAAQRLMQLKGWAQVSIQDVIDEAAVSKGAFYHYYDSKAALLDDVVTRLVDAALAAIEPAVTDPNRSALEQFDALFSGLAEYKTERKEFMIALMRVWLSDENVMMRERCRRGALARITPLIAQVIRKGVSEGSFRAVPPDNTARVLASLVMGLNEAATDLFVAGQLGAVVFEEGASLVTAFGEAFEQILGTAPGALGFERRWAVVRDWFDSPSPITPRGSA
jgi:AcrR family transcriptional regulator